MSDIRTLLNETAGTSAPSTSTGVADAHLATAQRALRRRNAKRISFGATLVTVTALGAFAVMGSTSAPTLPAATPSTTTTSGVELVDYNGTQPTGYSLDKVPAGWRIDHDDLSLLTLAPAGSVSDGETDGPIRLEGKIAISTEADTGVPSGVQLDDVQVGGVPGVIAHMEGPDDTRTLFVKGPTGTYLQIQVWSGLGWDNDEIATFASSVHINPGSVPAAG